MCSTGRFKIKNNSLENEVVTGTVVRNALKDIRDGGNPLQMLSDRSIGKAMYYVANGPLFRCKKEIDDEDYRKFKANTD